MNAVLFGRARDFTEKEKDELDNILLSVIRNEFKLNDLLIVTNLDFGHTDPQFILPLGVATELNPLKKTFKLIENPFN